MPEKNPTRKNPVGQKFGNWTVLNVVPGTRFKPRRYICKCTCGNIKSVRAFYLTSGKSKGCKQCHSRQVPVTGKSGRTPEYVSWQAMKRRCLNKGYRNYKRYGGRGITVCERWRTSFDDFLADMGRKPTPKHQIDRIDNDKGYSPDNCRWATPKENCQNKSKRA